MRRVYRYQCATDTAVSLQEECLQDAQLLFRQQTQPEQSAAQQAAPVQELLTNAEQLQEQIEQLKTNLSCFEYLQEVTVEALGDHDLLQFGVYGMLAVLDSWIGVDIDMCNQYREAISESTALLESNQPLDDVLGDNEFLKADCEMAIKNQRKALSDVDVDNIKGR